MQQERNHVQALVENYNQATEEERAFFGVEALPSMLAAIDTLFGHYTEVKEAHPLRILCDEKGKLHAFVGDRRLLNGDILDLVIGIPQTSLPVWVEGLPSQLKFCIMATFDVTEIKLAHGSLLRWPRRPPAALKQLVDRRMEQLKQDSESDHAD